MVSTPSKLGILQHGPVIDVFCWPPTAQTLDFKNVLLSQTTFTFLCIWWTVNIQSTYILIQYINYSHDYQPLNWIILLNILHFLLKNTII